MIPYHTILSRFSALDGFPADVLASGQGTRAFRCIFTNYMSVWVYINH